MTTSVAAHGSSRRTASADESVTLRVDHAAGESITGPRQSLDLQQQESGVGFRSLIVQLYASHFLSTWNSRSFEFAAILFLAEIYPETLLFVSIYAVVRGAVTMILAQDMGRWIDRYGRLTVVRLSIVGQRLAVIGSCVLFWFMTRPIRLGLRHGLFSVTVILACVEKVCSTTNLISVERDWVVVITRDSESSRRTLNARMRRIDLFCKLLGPLVISFIAIASVAPAIWTTFSINIVSLVVEYLAIRNVYRHVPALSERDNEHTRSGHEPGQRLHLRLCQATRCCMNFSSMKYYFTHPAFLPSFSLSLLYLTVLSFSGQMVTYLISIGYTSVYVGVARAVSTVFELSATWLAPRLMNRIGVIRGGLWSISWQMACLAGAMAWFFASPERFGSGHIGPATGLAIGVALSRVGLWGYDLCAQNIVQDEVETGHRGAFSASEAAFQNLFEILSYATTIVFSRPDQFQWPMIISVAAVYLAGALYSFFVRERRRHLFHVSDCVRVKRPESQA